MVVLLDICQRISNECHRGRYSRILYLGVYMLLLFPIRPSVGKAYYAGLIPLQTFKLEIA